MFFYEHIFYLFSYIHRAHNIFSRDACSLGNVFPLNVLHLFLLVIFQHNNMNSHWMLCSQIVAEQVDVSVLFCTICDFDICVKLKYFKKNHHTIDNCHDSSNILTKTFFNHFTVLWQNEYDARNWSHLSTPFIWLL